MLGSELAGAKALRLKRADPVVAVVSTLVNFTAEPNDSEGEELILRYRCRARSQGGDYRMMRDYGPLTTLDWTATKREGTYKMEVSMRNVETAEESSTGVPRSRSSMRHYMPPCPAIRSMG